MFFPPKGNYQLKVIGALVSLSVGESSKKKVPNYVKVAGGLEGRNLLGDR